MNVAANFDWGFVLLLDPADLHLQGMPKQGVYGGKGLVQKQHLWFGYKGPCQGRPLLLASGKLRRILVGIFRQTYDVDHAVHCPSDLILGYPLLFQAECHVLPDVHVGEEAVVLKDHAYVPVLGSHIGDVLPVQVYLAGCSVLKAGQDPEQGTFSASGRPQQSDQLSFFDPKVYVLQDLFFSEILADVFKTDIFSHAISPSALCHFSL